MKVKLAVRRALQLAVQSSEQPQAAEAPRNQGR
jgi:hypothetical protein